MGDIFRVGGGLFLMLSQATRQAYPCLTFSSVSACSCAAGSGCRADGCAPRARAVLMISMVQGVSMVASQLLVEKSKSMGAAGCGATWYNKTNKIFVVLTLVCQ